MTDHASIVRRAHAPALSSWRGRDAHVLPAVDLRGTSAASRAGAVRSVRAEVFASLPALSRMPNFAAINAESGKTKPEQPEPEPWAERHGPREVDAYEAIDMLADMCAGNDGALRLIGIVRDHLYGVDRDDDPFDDGDDDE